MVEAVRSMDTSMRIAVVTMHTNKQIQRFTKFLPTVTLNVPAKSEAAYANTCVLGYPLEAGNRAISCSPFLTPEPTTSTVFLYNALRYKPHLQATIQRLAEGLLIPNLIPCAPNPSVQFCNPMPICHIVYGIWQYDRMFKFQR